MTIFEEIAKAVLEADEDKVVTAVDKALKQKVNPMEIIQKGLNQGLQDVGDKFEKMEIYLPEMMASAEAMRAGSEMVKPYLKGSSIQEEGVVVIGTVQGDVHDLGKNIVAFFLEVSGFKVYDLGIDLPVETFMKKAEEKQADIIGISAMLTSTMTYIPDVIEELKRRGLRDKYIVMVGGGPVTPEWASNIGANGTGADFMAAARVAKQLMTARRVGK
jgi:5-methyltetrahydrofolate--homocysteine methyltransferase